jgi:hypothetical protein
MKILCFGDSFTYGVGLPDYVEHGPNSLYAYPQLLAEQFGCCSLNLASPGASNKEIWNIILQTKLSPADIVVIMWSHPSRTCVINTPQEDPYTTEKWRIPEHVTGKFWTEHQTSIGTWMDNDDLSDSDLNVLANAYYKNIHNEVDADISTQLYMTHIDSYLKHIGIKTVVHAMIPWQSIQRTHWNDLRVLKFSPSGRTTDGHADENSHRTFAKTVAKQIHKSQK